MISVNHRDTVTHYLLMSESIYLANQNMASPLGTGNNYNTSIDAVMLEKYATTLIVLIVGAVFPSNYFVVH